MIIDAKMNQKSELKRVYVEKIWMKNFRKMLKFMKFENFLTSKFELKLIAQYLKIILLLYESPGR